MLAAPEPAARIAALAPGVLRRARRGSRAARRVVARGHDALAALLAEVCRQLRLRPPVAVSWAGGLLDDAGFRAGVWRAARRAGLSLHPEAPRESPAAAACRLAQRLDAPRARAAGVQRRAPRHDRKPR
jgi:N-acetylglucosamine kinase-like BadF-type ATPase